MSSDNFDNFIVIAFIVFATTVGLLKFIFYRHEKAIRFNWLWDKRFFVYNLVFGLVVMTLSLVIYIFYNQFWGGKIIEEKSQYKNQSTQQEIQQQEQAQKPSVQDEVVGWQVYINSKDYYEIKYNSPPYKVWLDHNLINYDANDPRYEMGNPDGVKIQIQKHSLANGQIFIGAITEANKNIKVAGNNANETLIEKYDLGNIQYANKTLYGPGGRFDTFYSPSNDSKSYFSILVWGMDNDKENINLILSTFKFIDQQQVEGWKMYRNEEYGFQLTLNDNWQGYKVLKNEFPDEKVVRFDFEIPYLNNYVRIFSVSINLVSEWEKNPGEIQPAYKNDNYVFWVFYPSDVYSDQNLNSLVSRANKAGSSFQLIK